MWNINYNIKKLLPIKKPGYEFVKTLNLFIPYKEIGLITLIRKEQPLPFFFEMILKLVNCQCYEITNISELTGVEEEILNNVVGDMSRRELVYIKSGMITLTPKGKVALEKLIQTTLEKEELNKVFINGITGEIEDLDRTYNRPTFGNPCLDEKIEVTEEFITSHFNGFNEYYQYRQLDFEGKGQVNNEKNEIYQIIEKKYEKLCYIIRKTFVYKNIRDNTIIFECENDVDNVYGTILAKQIRHRPGARRCLTPPFKCNLNEKITISKEKLENTQNLIQVVENMDESNCNEDLETNYFKTRLLFEKEYEYILTSIKDIRPSEIIISSGKLRDVLTDNIIASLQSSLNYAKVTIVFDDKESGIESIKNKVNKYNRKNKIEWFRRNGITCTKIVLYPECIINIKYNPFEVDADYLIHEIADICFDEEQVMFERDSLIDSYKNNKIQL